MSGWHCQVNNVKAVADEVPLGTALRGSQRRFPCFSMLLDRRERLVFGLDDGVTPPLVKNCTLRRAAGQGMAGSEGT